MASDVINQMTLVQAQETFFYDPETGYLHWKIRPSQRALWGMIAGGRGTTGYRYLSVNGIPYGQHSLVWNFHYGTIPKGMTVDHKDKNPLNNKIENLRLATSSQQCINRGVRGFTFMSRKKKNKWMACNCRNYQSTFLGYYSTALQARLAYEKHTYQLEPAFACTHFTDALREICSGGVQTTWRPGYSA